MSQLELGFESGEDSLSVRKFSVEEAMSGLFSISVVARSPNDDIDLETIVGRAASFRVRSGLLHALSGRRAFHGVCCEMEQQQAETAGLSTYRLRIVPRLWLLGQRINYRLFQHVSIPDIVTTILREWDVPFHLAIDVVAHPRLELRTQYGESDLAFVHRLLEEAGIAYFFADESPDGSITAGSVLVLCDAPQSAEPRTGGPLPYVDAPNASAELEYVTELRIVQRVKPGKVTMRDHDFRRRPTFPLFGQHQIGKGVEERLEHYHFTPGGFLVDLEKGEIGRLGEVVRSAAGIATEAVSGYIHEKIEGAVSGKIGEVLADAGGAIASRATGKLASMIADGIGRLVGDDKGLARHTEKAGARRASVALEAERGERRTVSFATNTIELAPGSVFSVVGHPRSDLDVSKKLLVTSFVIEGTHDGEWQMRGEAVFADVPHRPLQHTPKPYVMGPQSAVVVGPEGEEIHTDEHGRVRVQFHWDRIGIYDDDSSCWMRVSQGWAGTGFGMITIPRVGQEVLVAFLEGNPDNPVVVGRLFNGTARTPYDLPQHKTRSGWRSDSTPGSGGYNELMFEDAKGRELVRLHAQRDLDATVNRSETLSVGKNRRATIGAVDESRVGARYNVTMNQSAEAAGKIGPTFQEMIDRRIVLSTGEASITLDGPNITLEAKGKIFVHSEGDDVELLGGPWVKINCGEAHTEQEHALVLTDPFGNVAEGSYLRGSVVIDGNEEEVDEFVARSAKLAPGKSASVVLYDIDDDEGDEVDGDGGNAG